MGVEGWPVSLHRNTGVGLGAECGRCSPPLYIGETGLCVDSTTATYNVQCTVEGTAITMVFDVTGVTNTEIGRWTCNPADGWEPEASIIFNKLGTYNGRLLK